MPLVVLTTGKVGVRFEARSQDISQVMLVRPTTSFFWSGHFSVYEKDEASPSKLFFVGVSECLHSPSCGGEVFSDFTPALVSQHKILFR